MHVSNVLSIVSRGLHIGFRFPPGKKEKSYYYKINRFLFNIYYSLVAYLCERWEALNSPPLKPKKKNMLML